MTDLEREAAFAVVVAVREYQRECQRLGYRAFAGVDGDHPINLRVESLQNLCPPHFTLPEPGQTLYREFVNASTCPLDADYLRVFDALERFLDWLIRFYQLTDPDRSPSAAVGTPKDLRRNRDRDAEIVRLRDEEKVSWAKIPKRLLLTNPEWSVSESAARKAYSRFKKRQQRRRAVTQALVHSTL